MSEFKIESGVPIPASRGGGGAGDAKYPWPDMRPGDSFFAAPTGGQTAEKCQNSLVSCIAQYAKRHAPDAKFATRQVDGGVRVWRVK